MREQRLIDKVKNLVYKITLPIYLWSIGFKTLEEYITCLEKEYERNKEYLQTNTLTEHN